MSLQNIVLYRITHLENIPHVLLHGITHRASPEANMSYVNIGDVSLIGNRADRRVSIDNGNKANLAEAETILLGDYTPFYFGVRIPMLFTIQTGGNFVPNATPAENIVYIAISLKYIIDTGAVFYFSDGHATNNFTSFYNKKMISNLPAIIDWNAVKASYWGGDENLNIKRKKQAECLIEGDISPSAIVGFGCYNENAKTRLSDYGVGEEIIKIIPKAYF